MKVDSHFNDIVRKSTIGSCKLNLGLEMGWHCPGESCSIGRWGKAGKMVSSLYHLCMLTKDKQTLWIFNRSGSCTLLSCNWWYCFSHMLVLHRTGVPELVQTLKDFCCKKWLPTFVWRKNVFGNTPRSEIAGNMTSEAYGSKECIFVGGSILDLFHDLPGMKCRRK
jgi:hypothetical protein